MKIMNLLALPIILVFAITFFACDDSGGTGIPVADEDIEYADWEEEEEIEPEIENADWDRMNFGNYTNDRLEDSGYGEWHKKTWETVDGKEIGEVRAIEQWTGGNGGTYIGTTNGVFYYNPSDQELEKITYQAGIDNVDVIDMAIAEGTLYILSSDIKLYSLRFNSMIKDIPGCDIADDPYSLGVANGTTLYIATGGGIYRLSGTSCSKKSSLPGGNIIDIATDGNTRMAMIRRNRGSSKSDEVILITDGVEKAFTSEDGLMTGKALSVEFYTDDDKKRKELWVSFTTGIMRYNINTANWTTFEAKDGQLPYENVWKLKPHKNGEIWGVSTMGAMKFDPDSEYQRWNFFKSRRWNLTDNMTAIGFENDPKSFTHNGLGGVFFGHPNGVTRIWQDTYTLAEKATHFQNVLYENHLYKIAELSKVIPNTCARSDKDGLGLCTPHEADEPIFNAGLYALNEILRAMALDKGNAEKDKAKQNAKNAVYLLLETEKATKDNIPGMPASEIAVRGNGPDGWFRSDYYDWRGDPSGNLVFMHFLVYAFYYDLLADEAYKQRIREAIDRITSHIIEFQYRIKKEDDQFSTSANWSEEYVTGETGKKGEGALKATQILSMLRIALHITGDIKYWEAYIDRAFHAGYANMTLHQKKMSQAREQRQDLDFHAFLAYLALFRYEDIADFYSVYMDSIKEAYNYDAAENNPFFNIVYGVAAHNDFGLDKTIETLQKTPMDFLDWNIGNCPEDRKDVTSAADSPSGDKRINVVLPVEERSIIFLDDDPFACAWKGDAQSDPTGGWNEANPLSFLLPYWLGKYYLMIGD